MEEFKIEHLPLFPQNKFRRKQEHNKKKENNKNIES